MWSVTHTRRDRDRARRALDTLFLIILPYIYGLLIFLLLYKTVIYASHIIDDRQNYAKILDQRKKNKNWRRSDFRARSE